MNKEWLHKVLETHKIGKTFTPGIKVSVIYPYFERAEYLVKSIASVKAQVSERLALSEMEIIVVDDGSEGDEIEKQLPDDVIYLWQKKFRFGLSRARNVAAKIANGRYLFFLDPDMLVSPGYFDAALKNFATWGDRVLQTGFVWDYAFPGAEDVRVQFGCWENPDRPCDHFLHLGGNTMAMSAALFREVGGFDEDLVYGGWEDILFGYLAGKRPGTAMIYNTKMECWHMPHPPGLRLACTDLSMAILEVKYPDYFQHYCVEENR